MRPHLREIVVISMSSSAHTIVVLCLCLMGAIVCERPQRRQTDCANTKQKAITTVNLVCQSLWYIDDAMERCPGNDSCNYDALIEMKSGIQSTLCEWVRCIGLLNCNRDYNSIFDMPWLPYCPLKKRSEHCRIPTQVASRISAAPRCWHPAAHLLWMSYVAQCSLRYIEHYTVACASLNAHRLHTLQHFFNFIAYKVTCIDYADTCHVHDNWRVTLCATRHGLALLFDIMHFPTFYMPCMLSLMRLRACDKKHAQFGFLRWVGYEMEQSNVSTISIAHQHVHYMGASFEKTNMVIPHPCGYDHKGD